MKVVWTREAEKSFDRILDYLMEVWTSKEALAFVDMVDETVGKISVNPKMFKVSQYDDKSREALITKHTTMFYRIFDDVIEIEYFWGNFQDPKKIARLLT